MSEVTDGRTCGDPDCRTCSKWLANEESKRAEEYCVICREQDRQDKMIEEAVFKSSMERQPNTYLVTVQVQVLVSARDACDARLSVLESVDTALENSVYSHDPMNGRIVTSVELIPDVEYQ